MELAELQSTVVAFADAREWAQFHDAKNLAMALASEVGELNAVLRWVPNSLVDVHLSDVTNGDALRAEIADVAILLLLLCARTGVDLGEAVRSKLERNATKYPVEQTRGKPEAPSA